MFPRGKWTACEKIEQLHDIKNMDCTKVTDSGQECCVCSLHIKMYELYMWNERRTNGNIGLQHLIETFYAILCYLILFKYNPAEADVDSDDEIENGLTSHYTRHIEFIKTNWYQLMADKTSLSPYLITIIESSTFKAKKIEEEKDLYSRYLKEYLAARGLDIDLETYKHIHTAHYSRLFDEYFEGRSTGLVNSFGGFGPNKYTKHSFLTAHVNDDHRSCVGFVCLREYLKSERNLSMQGIVACPFYRSCQSPKIGKLGAANSLILFLNRYREGRNIQVDPISQNIQWNNRLADVSFFVNSHNQPLQKREEPHKKQKLG